MTFRGDDVKVDGGDAAAAAAGIFVAAPGDEVEGGALRKRARQTLAATTTARAPAAGLRGAWDTLGSISDDSENEGTDLDF